MRPLTEALLRANAENLTQKGWKPDEQFRCFRKADALLDYIAKIKPSEYTKIGSRTQLNDQRMEGFRYCLEKGMSSHLMQNRSLEVLSQLLSIGEEMLIRAAWLYKNRPALFKARYALSPQAFQKDAHFYFIKGHVVPENSFPSFKTGENPAASRDNTFLDKCIEMYNDSVFESPEYQVYLGQRKNRKDPYMQWRWRYRAGRRFSDENLALHHVIRQLTLRNEATLKVDKVIESQLVAKKQKTK